MSENMSIKNLQDYMEKEKIQDKKIKELEEKLQDFKQTIAYLNEKLNKFISENKKKNEVTQSKKSTMQRADSNLIFDYQKYKNHIINKESI